jgi:hypothetical protein
MDLVFGIGIAILIIISVVWAISERRAEKEEASLYLGSEDNTPTLSSSSGAIYTQIIRPEHYRHNPRNFDGNPRNDALGASRYPGTDSYYASRGFTSPQKPNRP